MRNLILVILTAVASFAQQAAVTQIIDGDTFAANVGGKTEHIRLNCIDAPESQQTYGAEAADALRGIIAGKTVTLNTHARDKDGRILADVFLGAQFVNLRMVDEGHAWMYREHCSNEAFAHSESNARATRIGLWRSTSVLKPWEFRAAQKPFDSTATVQSPSTTPLPGKPTILNADPADPEPAKPTVLNAEATAASPTPPAAQTSATPRSQSHTEKSAASSDGRIVYTGPRGGKYTISPSGKKVYLPRVKR